MWLAIITFIIALVILYNKTNNEYIDLGEDAPLPTALHPILEKKKEQLLEKTASIGIDVLITEKWRSIERQNKLYAQGRTTDGSIVTYSQGGESYHNYGLAIDYAILKDDGSIIWDTTYDGNNNGKKDWFEVAEIAKDLGFEWGGDWSNFKDYPHLQMDFGLRIRQLKKGLRPNVQEETK
ncbi:M15 family metallopeptidase [Virgibacillus sp. DJP39]|uniref:M15 family metallopeptidase n=1 Tax=Virgibacillus sp. DJP39 TaxID=3409790 RepID=UPI003BB5E99A